VGATGSGKSTVAGSVPRFYDVRTRLGAHRRRRRAGTSACNDLRRSSGIVFEETFLFSSTDPARTSPFADPDASDEA
jgi:ABC-type multidrug transport system fused ATPase/permease subunit